jgi:hypothetical protein
MTAEPKVGDLIYGAKALATFLFGNAEDNKNRRKIYGLAQTGVLPLFKLNNVLCGRASAIATALAEREKEARRLPPSSMKVATRLLEAAVARIVTNPATENLLADAETQISTPRKRLTTVETHKSRAGQCSKVSRDNPVA